MTDPSSGLSSGLELWHEWSRRISDLDRKPTVDDGSHEE